MLTDTENLLWSIRDMRAGILPRKTRFTHRDSVYIADFKKKGANVTVAVNNIRTKTVTSCTMAPNDFHWAEDMMQHILKTCCENQETI